MKRSTLLLYMILNGQRSPDWLWSMVQSCSPPPFFKGQSDKFNKHFCFVTSCFVSVEQWRTTKSSTDCIHVDHKHLDDPLPMTYTIIYYLKAIKYWTQRTCRVLLLLLTLSMYKNHVYIQKSYIAVINDCTHMYSLTM